MSVVDDEASEASDNTKTPNSGMGRGDTSNESTELNGVNDGLHESSSNSETTMELGGQEARELASNQDSSSLFVGDLPRTIDENDIFDIFSKYGTVIEVIVKRSKLNGLPLGYGFVKMGSHDEAQEAMQALNNSVQGGRFIRVGWARRNSSCLYIENICSSVTEEELRAAFSAFGELDEAKTTLEPGTDGAMGTATVHFMTRVAALLAKSRLNRHMMGTSPIIVEWGQPPSGANGFIRPGLHSHHNYHNHHHNHRSYSNGRGMTTGYSQAPGLQNGQSSVFNSYLHGMLDDLDTAAPAVSLYVNFRTITPGLEVDEDMLFALFSQFSSPESVHIKSYSVDVGSPDHRRGYAFVHFASNDIGREQAVRVVKTARDVVVDGVHLMSELSKNFRRGISNGAYTGMYPMSNGSGTQVKTTARHGGSDVHAYSTYPDGFSVGPAYARPRMLHVRGHNPGSSNGQYGHAVHSALDGIPMNGHTPASSIYSGGGVADGGGMSGPQSIDHGYDDMSGAYGSTYGPPAYGSTQMDPSRYYPQAGKPNPHIMSYDYSGMPMHVYYYPGDPGTASYTHGHPYSSIGSNGSSNGGVDTDSFVPRHGVDRSAYGYVDHGQHPYRNNGSSNHNGPMASGYEHHNGGGYSSHPHHRGGSSGGGYDGATTHGREDATKVGPAAPAAGVLTVSSTQAASEEKRSETSDDSSVSSSEGATDANAAVQPRPSTPKNPGENLDGSIAIRLEPSY